MSSDKRFFYGVAEFHPMFQDELRNRGVQLILRDDPVGAHQSSEDHVVCAVRYPESRHSDVLGLCSISGGAVAVEVQLVDHEMDLIGGPASLGAAQIEALSNFHQYGLEAASTEAERAHHERVLERLKTAWGRSLRLVERQPDEARATDPGMAG